jgi:tetratricopeptide (TPR) repeat protein
MRAIAAILLLAFGGMPFPGDDAPDPMPTDAKPVVAADPAELLRLNAKVAELYAAGRYIDAERQSRMLAGRTEQKYGPRHSKSQTALANLAELQRLMGHYDEAERTYETLLSRIDEDSDRQLPRSAEIRCNLALLHCDQGRYDEAEPALKQVLRQLQAKLGPLHSLTLQTQTSHAMVLRYQGLFSESLKELLFVWDVLTSQAADPVLAATVLNNLGDLYQSLEQPDEATGYYQRSQQLLEKHLGRRHPLVALAIHNRAALECERKDYAEAKKRELAACAILKDAIGTAHPQYAMCGNKLAEIHVGLDELDAARDVHRESAEILRRTVGEAHPLYAANLRVNGEILAAQGQLAEAESVLAKALEIQERIAAQSELANRIRSSLRAILLKAGKSEAAETLRIVLEQGTTARTPEKSPP